MSLEQNFLFVIHLIITIVLLKILYIMICGVLSWSFTILRNSVNFISDHVLNLPTLNTAVIHYCSSAKSFDLRQSFRELDVHVKNHQMPNHSHPGAAGNRCVGNIFIDHFIIANGYEPFSISRSKPESDHGVAGSRLYYHAKDLQMEPSYVVKPMKGNYMLKATDVDYYCDLPRYLDGKHLLLYTFVPNTAAGSTGNGTFCITSDDCVSTYIDGGAQYTHKIWDFESDHFVVDHWWGASVYLVESRNITVDRRVIFFNHVRNVYGPIAWLLQGKRLYHRRITYGNFGFIKNQIDNVINYSFNIINTTEVATVSESTFYNAYLKYTNSSKPNMGDVERVIRGTVDDKVAAQYAAVLFQVFSSNDIVKQIATIRPITKFNNENVNSYYPLKPLVFDDGKPSMRTVGPNYMNDAFHPCSGINSDDATIQGRIKDVQNKNLSVPPFYYTCMNEFITMLVPNHRVGTIIPEDFEYIYDKWSRPTQRRMLENAKHLLYNCVPKVKSFMKHETYGKVTHPRNISTLPAEHNCRLGQYIYPLAQLLKDSGWYVFGKEPVTVAEMVHNMASKARFIVPTDVSKLDGSCGAFHTRIIMAVISRAVAPAYRAEALRLINAERSIAGTTKFGLRYHVEDTTLSGSSQTAFRNSTICACLCYIALRVTGYDKNAAWSKLGVYGGDDGATPDVDPDVLANVFARTGLHLKSEVITPGQTLAFLGRCYIDPWTSNCSIVDVPRQFRKVHLSASPISVPNSVALRRKAAGILINDPDTPIISDWAAAVLRVIKPISNEDRFKRLTDVDTPYWSNCSDPFPTPSRDVAVDIVKQMFLDLGVDVDVEFWSKHFQNAKSVNDLNAPYVIDVKPKIEIDCIMNGEVITAPSAPTHQEKLKVTRNKVKQKTKRASKVGKGKTADKTTKERPLCNLAPNCTRSNCRFRHP